jgi:ABC-2 type transport system ATP-binding protein
VIVLDEPTAGVDVELRQGLWAFVRRLNREGHTIVLTTHYLEEAQQLCGRIAMLKGGRLIALDRTQALLERLADVQVTLRIAGELPPALRGRAKEQGDGRVRLRVDSAADVEGVLAACREAGCGIDEVEVGHADLEDVFMQLMAGDRERVAA